MQSELKSQSGTASLPPALEGERREINGRAGRLSFYRSLSASAGRPLLLVHSINAAAGAHEVRPLFERYGKNRPVYAPDLPGYGYSDRKERPYTPRLMTDALHDVIEEIRRDHGNKPIDALALSLSCEFLSRAALEAPESISSLALVSPTAFNRSEPIQSAPGADRGFSLLLQFLKLPGLGRLLFRLLASPPSIRFFLRRTWGSKTIDETFFKYACLTVKQPGARRAPFYFLSGYLFSADINTVYADLAQPVWMSHGVRGDFTDFRLKEHFRARANWSFREFESGALPFFELTEEFIAAFDEFLTSLDRTS